MSRFYFRRYTTLPILLDVLSNKRLTLLDPKNWDDKNDSYFIELYKNRKNLKSVLALCFAEVPDTYHHWKVFAGNDSGVCIVFYKDILLNYFGEGFRKQKVDYPFRDNMEFEIDDFENLPFVKRYAFRDEREFRIIYEDKRREIATKDVDIPLKSIEHILINPWMPKSVYSSVKKVIRNIEGCRNIKILRTTMVEDERWKRIGRKIATR